MNNNEAKRVILEADSCFCKHGAYKDCHSGCKYREALDVAIKALEHPEKNAIAVVSCGDTVSRQAVIDLMMQKWGENFSGDDAMQESIDAIRVMPSVIPQEPKTGHWIRISPAEIYECSECGQNVMTSDICVYKFCHGCGAKMVEPQESEDEKEGA